MKNLFFVLLILLSFAAITSCQPEVAPLPNQRVDSTGGLLVKLDFREGADTMFVTIRYDAQQRWAGSEIKGILGGDTTNETLSIFRDASGIITKVVDKDSSDLTDIFTETKIVLHNAATGRYTRVTSSFSQPNFIPDTSDFVYNNQGQIIIINQHDPNYIDTILCRYNGANLDTVYGSPGPVPVDDLLLKYDNKIAPFTLQNEAMIIDLPELYGLANVAMYTHRDYGQIDAQGIITYTYNTAGKPIKAMLTMLPSNEHFTFNYHYQ